MALGWLGGGGPWTSPEADAFGLVLLAAFVFTTPWDNLAVRWGIWGFPRTKYLFRVGYLPIEEYAFFLLQSAAVMLAVRTLFRFQPAWQTQFETPFTSATTILLVASILPWLIVVAGAWWLRRHAGPRVNYALHLAWFLPVIYSQWIIAPELFLNHAELLALITGAFGIYYTLADLFAVRAGVWFFDEAQITGVKLGGVLPWEEIAFFALTTLLVAQSYLLLLPSKLR